MGIYYTPELTRHLIEQASEAAIVQGAAELPDHRRVQRQGVHRGGGIGLSFSMENLFSIDEALQNAFQVR